MNLTQTYIIRRALSFLLLPLVGCGIASYGWKAMNSGGTAKKYDGPLPLVIENQTGAQSITSVRMTAVDDQDEGDDWIGFKGIPSGETKAWKVRSAAYRIAIKGGVFSEDAEIVSYKAKIGRLSITRPTRIILVSGDAGARDEGEQSGERVIKVAVKVVKAATYCPMRLAVRLRSPSQACPGDTFVQNEIECYWQMPAGCPCLADTTCAGELTCQPWSGSQATCGSPDAAEETFVASLDPPAEPGSNASSSFAAQALSAPESGAETAPSKLPLASPPASASEAASSRPTTKRGASLQKATRRSPR